MTIINRSVIKNVRLWQFWLWNVGEPAQVYYRAFLLFGRDHGESKQAHSVGNNLIKMLNWNKPMGHTLSILFNLDQSNYESV